MPDGPRIKICGLRRAEDVRAADALGVGYLGVVLSAGFARSVAEPEAPTLVAGVGATTVAVLVDEAPEDAARLARALGAGVVQLHGSESPAQVERLRTLGPWRIWKAVRAQGPEDVTLAVARYGALVDGLLVEGRKPGVVGGGGARLDPAFGRLRDLVPKGVELVLAGGLTPDIVGEAVNRHAPDVVDVSSGVEREPGRKDHGLLRRFVAAARGGPPPTGSPYGEDR